VSGYRSPDSDRVLGEVGAERARQDERWGEQNHAPIAWIAVLGEEFGEAAQAALNLTWLERTGFDDRQALRRELIQVAAVAVAAIESLDRGRATPSEADQ
jgi:NTP pyrophosphatase (non-canonical NTP hydrolase)